MVTSHSYLHLRVSVTSDLPCRCNSDEQLLQSSCTFLQDVLFLISCNCLQDLGLLMTSTQPQ